MIDGVEYLRIGLAARMLGFSKTGIKAMRIPGARIVEVAGRETEYFPVVSLQDLAESAKRNHSASNGEISLAEASKLSGAPHGLCGTSHGALKMT